MSLSGLAPARRLRRQHPRPTSILIDLVAFVDASRTMTAAPLGKEKRRGPLAARRGAGAGGGVRQQRGVRARRKQSSVRAAAPQSIVRAAAAPRAARLGLGAARGAGRAACAGPAGRGLREPRPAEGPRQALSRASARPRGARLRGGGEQGRRCARHVRVGGVEQGGGVRATPGSTAAAAVVGVAQPVPATAGGTQRRGGGARAPTWRQPPAPALELSCESCYESKLLLVAAR
jgi:hypothetical protein